MNCNKSWSINFTECLKIKNARRPNCEAYFLCRFGIKFMQTLSGEISSLEEAKEYIYSLNFDRIIAKLCKEGWIRSDAEKSFQMFKRFLFLRKKYPSFKHLVPSKDIDECWHAFILDTMYYRATCKILFHKEYPDQDGYLDHYPYFGIDDNGDKNSKILSNAFAATQDLYFKEFGERIVPTRSKFPSLIYYILRKIS